VNYRFSSQGRDLLATVVTVPELENQTFIELETIAEPDDVDAALGVVRGVLGELGIESGDLTTEAYTDAVAARRG
jgi:adenylate cyclase class 2